MPPIRHLPYLLIAAMLVACGPPAQGQTEQFAGLHLEPLPPVDDRAIPQYVAQAPIDPATPPWQLFSEVPQPYAFADPATIPLDQSQICPPPKSAGRDGMLQKFTFLDTWLPKIGPQGQMNEDIELNALLGIPFPLRESPILLKPSFEAHYWSGLDEAVLPSDLYDAYLDILWLHNWTPTFQTILGVSPGSHGDWKNANEEAFRVQILAIGNYIWSPILKIVLGAKYLDRSDVLVLPIFGFVWTPSEDQEWNLVFPQPKISYRFYGTEMEEYWVALGGELGGGIWGFEHADGSLDVVMTRDYRVYLGLDHKLTGCLTSRLELGYVFGRQIEFQSGLPDIKPADTMMLRVGLLY